MAQVHVIGRITADLELKYTQQRKPYLRFDFAENIGSGDRARVQYYQVWAWGEDAMRLFNAKVRKGSHLWITGSLELESFAKHDGRIPDKRMKVMLNDWSFLQLSSSGNLTALQQKNTACSTVPVCGELDGDRENLPE